MIEDHELFLETDDTNGDLPSLPKLGQSEDEKARPAFEAQHRRGSVTASFRGFVSHVHKGFFQDSRSLAEGTIPQSVVLSFVIGIVCGVASYLYYTILFFLLEFCWHTIPKEYIVNYWPEEYHWIYAPIVSFSFALLVGLSVVFLGEPGDLPFTIGTLPSVLSKASPRQLPHIFFSMTTFHFSSAPSACNTTANAHSLYSQSGLHSHESRDSNVLRQSVFHLGWW